MNTVILTSCLDLYEKDENGNKIPHNFGNENGILDCLKKELKNNNNFSERIKKLSGGALTDADIDSAKKGDISFLLKSLPESDARKVKEILSDEKKQKEFLSSDAAKKLLDMLGGKGNG